MSAISSAFKLSFRADDKFSWPGYCVKCPQVLPQQFKKTEEVEGSSSWNGAGTFKGYSIRQLVAHVLPDGPVEMMGGSDSERYDVSLEVWPEKGGQIVALRRLGFEITTAKIPKRTLVISGQQ